MQYFYYINAKGKKDGPHDMVTLMRRIRSGIIHTDTMVSLKESEDEFFPAFTIEDLALFFNRAPTDIRQEFETEKTTISFRKAFLKGWAFTLEHQSMPVFAGAILLFSAIFGMLVNEMLHNVVSAVTGSWIMFLLLQNCFFAVSLRLYRGQKTDLIFIEHTLAPIMGKVALASVIFSFLIIIGLIAFIIPSIIIMLICAYMPMFILDYDYSVTKTIKHILSLLTKLDRGSMFKLGLLTLSYMVCVVLLIPIPIFMPIMAGALCSIYEDISSS